MVSRSMACLVFCATLAPCAHAQDAEHTLRGRAMGEVRDRDNRPWAGVEVVLVSRPVPHALHLGEEDRVVAVADERGRFFADVLCGRPYTAWAWGEARDGGRPATQVVERVFAQRPILLRAERNLTRRRVRLIATESWAKHAPFKLRVVDGTMNRQVTWVEVGETGEVELPFLVGADAWVDVFGAGRYPIARVPLEVRTTIEIALPAAESIDVLVFGAVTKRPIAGASVLRSIEDGLGELFVAATTGADGRATILAANDPRPGVRRILVRAPECAMGVTARVSEIAGFPNVRFPGEARPTDSYVCMPAVPALHGRVLGAGGQPLAGAQLWCHGMADNKVSPSMGFWQRWQEVAVADAHGAFTLTDPGDNDRRSALLVLRERDYALLPPRWRRGLFPVVFAPLLGQAGRGTKEDPILVRLDAMCPIDLEFLGAGGAPGAEVDVSFAELVRFGVPPWGGSGGDIPVDARGRLRILVPGARHLGFRAVHGLSMLVRGFETSRGCAGAEPAAATFTLPPPASIRGQVLDKTGAPVAGRQVFAGFGTSNTPADWQYESEAAERLAATDRNALRLVNPTEATQRLCLSALVSRRVATDAEGRFALAMPPEAMPDLLLHVMGSPDGHEMRWSGESQEDIVVRFRW